MRRVISEEEIPKSVLKMKKDKEKREGIKRSNSQYNRGGKNSKNSSDTVETKNSKINKKDKTRNKSPNYSS